MWDRSQKGIRIIINRDVTFNESRMPYMEKGEHQEIVRKWSPIEVEKVSVHIPIISSEMENATQQNQQNVKIEGDEDIVEDNPITKTL